MNLGALEARSPRAKRISFFSFLGAVLCLALSSCSSGSASTTSTTSPPHGPVGAVVELKFISFKPQKVTIHVGQAVEWKWEDAPVSHNVTFSGFASPTMSTGTFFHTFDQAGTYDYRCSIHADMTGTVVVVP